ncbi:DedA family protein [Paenibacillus sp. ACRRY]|uniref:DedA family protein n=1 Tax=Paenibacillus sp. ACRRY TaxID=2918208 RepID=UPI001EF6FC9A|nr:DedA family protein [Paenibacillus sp. ACRRY]MCG7381740.1 DedA family protein [Paenibacillus sp. ACRRY]
MSNTILELIQQYGYLFLYCAFSLGPFGIPIPNEITIITGAILSHSGLINAWLTYFSILTGLLTAMTMFYLAGKLFGIPLKNRIQHKKYYKKAEHILKKKGDMAICIGMFIPVVRYFVPLLIGLSGTHYRKFALITYSTALLWTLLFFTAGTFFGQTILTLLSYLF